MEEYESFKLPCSIGHLLVFVGYAIFGGMYLIQLADSLVGRIARSSAKNEALLLVALTENELRGRSKENILDLLSKTRYPPYYKFGFHKYDAGYECIMYGGISIATLEGKFVFYDTNAVSIENTFATMNGPCDPYNRADRQKNEDNEQNEILTQVPENVPCISTGLDLRLSVFCLSFDGSICQNRLWKRDVGSSEHSHLRPTILVERSTSRPAQRAGHRICKKSSRPPRAQKGQTGN